MTRRSRLVPLLLLAALVAPAPAHATSPAVAAAAPDATSGCPWVPAGQPAHTFYVDGKIGSDDNDGLAPSDVSATKGPFKTVRRALACGNSTQRLVIKGYRDHVYHERIEITPSFNKGTESNRVIIEGAGWGEAGYVRPVIDGGARVPGPWAQVPGYSKVWKARWTEHIMFYEYATTEERLYLDVSTPLFRPTVKPTMAQLQATPTAYWHDEANGWLYVHPGAWSSTGQLVDIADPNLNNHRVDVPSSRGLQFSSGSKYVTVRGLDIRHTNMAIGFLGDRPGGANRANMTHHMLAEDIDASYNVGMGFWTNTEDNVFRNVRGRRNSLQLIKLDNGSSRNLVERARSTQNMGNGVKITGRDSRANRVKDSFFDGYGLARAASQYEGYVQGVILENGTTSNIVENNTIRYLPRGVMLLQATSAGAGALNGNIVRNNSFYSNQVAIHLQDGSRGTSYSTGSVTFSRNVYANNRRVVESRDPTSRKLFDHETMYNTTDHVFYLRSAGSVQVKNSIIERFRGNAFWLDSTAWATVTYSSVHNPPGAATSGRTNRPSRMTWGAGNVEILDPGFLSVSLTSPDFLTIDSSSPLYRKDESGRPMGARAR